MKVIFLELNEVSRKIIDQMISQGKLKNFDSVNKSYRYVTTFSDEKYENIEPWIQWVSAHTGKSFDQHKVFHLSDIDQLAYPQVWETLSQRGIESAIVGSMNVKQGNMQSGLFFPDPWTKDGKTSPQDLQPLWDLVAAKVQTHSTQKITLSDMLKGLRCSWKYKVPISLYLKIARQVIAQKINPKKKWKMPALFDQLLSYIFLSILNTTNYGFYTLFLNSCAHYQHHYWREFDSSQFSKKVHSPDIEKGDDPIRYGYTAYDEILGKVLNIIEKNKDFILVIATAFTQEPYLEAESEGGMNYYRLNNHRNFVKSLGVQCVEVYPLMSRDWQVSFLSLADMVQAKKLIESITLDGECIFSVQQNTEKTLFINTAITKSIKQEAIVMLGDHALGDFGDFFTNIAIKSGHHIADGSLWISKPVNGVKLKDGMPITDLYDLILEASGSNPKKSPL